MEWKDKWIFEGMDGQRMDHRRWNGMDQWNGRNGDNGMEWNGMDWPENLHCDSSVPVMPIFPAGAMFKLCVKTGIEWQAQNAQNPWVILGEADTSIRPVTHYRYLAFKPIHYLKTMALFLIGCCKSSLCQVICRLPLGIGWTKLARLTTRFCRLPTTTHPATLKVHINQGFQPRLQWHGFTPQIAVNKLLSKHSSVYGLNLSQGYKAPVSFLFLSCPLQDSALIDH